MQDITATHPTALTTYLERLDLTDLLTGYVDRRVVHARINVATLEVVVQRWGYCVAREGGNVYGYLMVTPATPAPVMRIVTRSDVAAVHGSKRAA